MLSGAFFMGKTEMWKIVVGFILFAGLALYLLSKGGDIDLGGEKHGRSSLSAPLVSANESCIDPAACALLAAA